MSLIVFIFDFYLCSKGLRVKQFQLSLCTLHVMELEIKLTLIFDFEVEQFLWGKGGSSISELGNHDCICHLPSQSVNGI